MERLIEIELIYFFMEFKKIYNWIFINKGVIEVKLKSYGSRQYGYFKIEGCRVRVVRNLVKV